MSYLRPALAPVRRARGAGGALPWGLGDIQAAPGPAALAQQVNRFGESAPASYQFVTTPFPVDTGKVDPALAVVALTIYQRRAADAYQQFHDAGSAAAIDAANAGFSNPVGFVTSHLSEVVTAVKGYADSVGLPAAGAEGGSGSSLDTTTLALAAVAAAALWWMGR